MPNPAQSSSFFCRDSIANSADSAKVSKNLSDKAVDADDLDAVDTFNSFYQKFAGSPIATRTHSHRNFAWSPAFTKIVLAGASGLVTTLAVTHVFVQNAPESDAYTYHEPVSSNRHSDSTAVSAAATHLAQAKPETIEASPRRLQLSQNASTVGRLQLPQIAPPESLAVIPLYRRTNPAAASAPDRSVPKPVTAAQSIAIAQNLQPQRLAGEPLLGLTSASLPASVQTNNLLTGEALNGAVERTAQSTTPSTTRDRIALSSPNFASEGDRVVTSAIGLSRAPLNIASTESASAAGQSLHDFLTFSNQGVSPQILPLSDRAALEVAQTDRVGTFRVVHLPLSAYQSIWLDLQSKTKAPLTAPVYGFIDYQQQIIALPTS